MPTMSRAARILLSVVALACLGCRSEAPNPLDLGSAVARLQPPTLPWPQPTKRGNVYVPVYSSIYLGLEQGVNVIDLGVTVSVRNTSPHLPLVLHAVDYHDSAGQLVRQYLTTPGELAPLATVEFVVLRSDVRGGPGANFLVRWEGQSGIDAPFMEAVMIGQFGNAGISFTSAGRPLADETSR